jgi:hypothetical protein
MTDSTDAPLVLQLRESPQVTTIHSSERATHDTIEPQVLHVRRRDLQRTSCGPHADTPVYEAVMVRWCEG